MREYVMVPVPEEFAEEVSRFLQVALSADERPELEEMVVARAIAALDDGCRALLMIIVDAMVQSRLATIPALSAELGCSEHEVLGRMMETNQVMRQGRAPVAMIPLKAPGAPTAALNDQMIAMAPDVARVVAAALRLETADEANPPTG